MTQRAKTDLDTLFADNVTKSITPANLRDFVESAVPSMGGIHFVDPGTPTTIAAPATWTKAANVSTLHEAYRFSMPANNRLRYDGLTTVRSTITATMSFTCASNQQVLAFAFAVNGVVDLTSKIRTKIATGTDVQAVTIIAHPVLVPTDYVEVWVSNDTSASNITIEHGHFHAVAFLT